MKSYIFLLVALFCGGIAQAQRVIELSSNKVSQFIFSEPIKDVRGGYLPDDILSEVKGNVLYMQPVAALPETNLNVITQSGIYYTFILRYNNSTKEFNHIINDNEAIFRMQPKASAEAEKQHQATTGVVEKILNDPSSLGGRTAARYNKTYMYLKGIYVTQDKIYFKLTFENKSNIRYDFDMVAFLSKAKKKKKKTTGEVLQMQPTKIYQEQRAIEANSDVDMIFEFDKFTLPKENTLFIEMIEKGGGRNIHIEVNNNQIINAKYV